jgi:DNA-binding NarL/FixJ family response regulator
LADDHPDLLLIVSDLLNSMFDVVGAVGDGESLLNAAAYLQPDVLVMDISMPVLTGIEAAQRLKERGDTARIVFLTVHDDPDFVRASLATGAFGYVVKPRLASDLVHAIREALSDRIFISPSVPTASCVSKIAARIASHLRDVAISASTFDSSKNPLSHVCSWAGEV